MGLIFLLPLSSIWDLYLLALLLQSGPRVGSTMQSIRRITFLVWMLSCVISYIRNYKNQRLQ